VDGLLTPGPCERWLCQVLHASDEFCKAPCSAVSSLSHTDDVTSVLSEHQISYHLCADDKQAYVSVPVNNVPLARRHVSVTSAHGKHHVFFSSMPLQLNQSGLAYANYWIN